MKYEAKLLAPKAPNYVLLDIPHLVGKETPKVRIADLSADQRDALASMFREELDRVAERQEANPEPVHRGERQSDA
jgi:hypothetical protein